MQSVWPKNKRFTQLKIERFNKNSEANVNQKHFPLPYTTSSLNCSYILPLIPQGLKMFVLLMIVRSSCLSRGGIAVSWNQARYFYDLFHKQNNYPSSTACVIMVCIICTNIYILFSVL